MLWSYQIKNKIRPTYSFIILEILGRFFFSIAIHQRNAYESPALILSNMNNSTFSISQHIQFLMWSSQYLTNHLTNLNNFFSTYFNGFFWSFHVSVIINAKYQYLLIGKMGDRKTWLFSATNERIVKRIYRLNERRVGKKKCVFLLEDYGCM